MRVLLLHMVGRLSNAHRGLVEENDKTVLKDKLPEDELQAQINTFLVGHLFESVSGLTRVHPLSSLQERTRLPTDSLAS